LANNLLSAAVWESEEISKHPLAQREWNDRGGDFHVTLLGIQGASDWQIGFHFVNRLFFTYPEATVVTNGDAGRTLISRV